MIRRYGTAKRAMFFGLSRAKRAMSKRDIQKRRIPSGLTRVKRAKIAGEKKNVFIAVLSLMYMSRPRRSRKRASDVSIPEGDQRRNHESTDQMRRQAKAYFVSFRNTLAKSAKRMIVPKAKKILTTFERVTKSVERNPHRAMRKTHKGLVEP